MANDYLVSKWRAYFGFFDHNKGGKVCLADMEAMRPKMARLNHVEGEESASESYAQWFKEYVLWGKESITVDEYIERNKAAFNADKNKFIERMQQSQEFYRRYVGTEAESYVSEDEFVNLFKAAGHEREDLQRLFYQTFKSADQKVAIEDMKKYWTHFLTSEDSLLPDQVLKGFESNVCK